MKNITNKSKIQFHKINPFILNKKITKDFFNKNKPINALKLKVKNNSVLNSLLENKKNEIKNKIFQKLLENGNYEIKDYLRAIHDIYEIRKFETENWYKLRKFEKKKNWLQIKKNKKLKARIKRRNEWRKKKKNKKNKKRDWLLLGLTKIKRRKRNQYQYYKLFTNYIPFLYKWDRKKKKICFFINA